MKNIEVSLSKPVYTGSEQEFIDNSILRRCNSGNGQNTGKVEDPLQTQVNPNAGALLKMSCTRAAIVTVIPENDPGDKVIDPSLTLLSFLRY